MENNQSYQLLLTQIGLSEVDEHLNNGTFTKVVADDDKRIWDFHIHYENMITSNLKQLLKEKLVHAFSNIAAVNLIVTFNHISESDMKGYIVHVLNNMDISNVVKEDLLNSEKRIVDDKLFITVGDELQASHFEKSLNGNLLNRLKEEELPIRAVIYEVNEVNNRDDFHDELQRETESIIQAFNQQKDQDEKEDKIQASQVEKAIGKHLDFDGVRPLNNIYEEEYNVRIEGMIFKKDVILTKTKRHILNIKVTDYTDSITAKMFSRNGKGDEAVFNALNEGDWVLLEGNVEYDDFEKELVLNIRSLKGIQKQKKTDTAEEKRVELHVHSQMSAMDALPNIKEYVERAKEFGHHAIAVTDHNTVQAFPDAYYASLDTGVKVIYGMEGMLVNDGADITYNPKPIPLKAAEYVIFDVETTGLSSKYDKIIELAAVRVKNGEIIDKFERFSDPGEKLTETIKELTGITDDMLRGQPPISEVIREFKEWVGDAVFVAHNASFDMGFIQAAYRKENLGDYENSVIDTLELSRTINTDMKKHGLNILAKKYNVELTQHHRAIYDTEATAYIFIKMLSQLEQLNILKISDIDATLSNKDSYKRAMPTHATLLVKNDVGLKNLFKIVSYSLTDNFYRTPRIRKKLLNQHREGLLIGSSCDDGELFNAVMQKPYSEAKEIAKYYDYIEVFPKDYYIRLLDREIIHDDSMLEDIIKNLIKIGDELGKPVVASGNVHYLDTWDKSAREILVKSNPGNPLSRGRLPDVHFRTTDEMLNAFDFLPKDVAKRIVVTNTNLIADSIEEVKPIKDKLYPPKIEGANEEIREICYQNAKALYGEDLPETVTARLEKELKSIIGNNFAVIYLISEKLVKRSLEDGYLVGSRGSVGSSFVATMLKITEVNPLPPHYICPKCKEVQFFTDGSVSSGYDLKDKNCSTCGVSLIKEGQDIPFETFLGFKGDKVPDIDLNFSGNYQPKAHLYTKELFGEDKVFRAGTIGTVAEKTAFGYVKGYINDNGLHKRKAEVDRLVQRCSGVKRTTGQHPGGIIVVPDYQEIFDFTPIQYPADDTSAEWKTTHFDFHSIHDNLLKLDILGHDDPTMIRMLQDLSDIDPKTIPLDDEMTMGLFSSPKPLGVTSEDILCKTGTLGVPEFGTGFVRQMLEETKPSTFSELVQISGLSHGSNVWLNNAQELVKAGRVELKDVIGCRDDIMVQLMYDGLEPSVAFDIMEKVRKGKGLSEAHESAMREKGVPTWYIESCKKIEYMFPKAHAAAYVMMAVRIAYFKVHYPIYYYASYFTVRASDFDLLTMVRDKEYVKQHVKAMYERDRNNELTKKEKDTLVVLEIANEMLHRGYTIQPVDMKKSDAFEFKIEDDTLIPPFISVPGLGASVAKRIVESRDDEMFISKEDIQKRGGVSQKIIDYLTELGSLEGIPDKAQLSLFDL